MSSFDGNLKDFLEQLTVISELTKEARTQISEFLKKGDSDEVTKIDIRDKLSNFTNTLNEETAKTQKKYSNLSKSILDALNKSKEAVSSESIPEENGNEVTDHIEKTYSMEENGENESKSEEKTEIKKPMLKIVDFSKLVDPRNLELMDKNHERKQRNQDSSVIILSSSDDESISAIKSNSQKSNKIEPQKLKSKNNLKVQKLSKNPVIYRTLSASKTKEPSIHLQKPKQNPETNRLRRISIDEEYKNDEKFRRRAYVNLLRIPCEQMKTYYLQNIHQKSNSKASSSSKSRDANESLERILDEKTGELVSNSAHSSNDECESRNLKNQDSSEDGEVPLISICKNKEKGVISENSPDKNLQNKRENETQSKNKKKVVEEKRNEESENEQVRRNLATKKLSEDISGSSCSEEEILKNQKKILEKRSKRNRNKKDTVSDSSDYEHSIIKKTRNNRNRNKKDVISNSSDEKSKTEIGKRKKTLIVMMKHWVIK
ncbi:hypothetical protein HHI36_002796 [Cryptolaemus montrouzieri]|uniref:Uncharacterized protein n=1 Tax=Cryptolaemus montrouzieri TaxID=559131 RepID=A0ABD2PBI3_9CUCU